MNRDRLAKLTDRQRECLREVGALKKSEQIAEALGISTSTVNTHIERAVAILEVPNRRIAAQWLREYEQSCPEKIPTELPRLSDQPGNPEPSVVTSSRWRRRNDLTWTQRLLYAVLALAALCFAIGGLGAAIEQLSDWRASHAKQQ